MKKLIFLSFTLFICGLGFIYLDQDNKSYNRDLVLQTFDLPVAEAEYFGPGIKNGILSKDFIKDKEFFMYCTVITNDSIKDLCENGSILYNTDIQKWKRLVRIEKDSVLFLPFVDATKEFKQIKQLPVGRNGTSMSLIYISTHNYQTGEKVPGSGKYYTDGIDATAKFFFPNYGVDAKLPLTDQRKYKGKGIYGDSSVDPKELGEGIHLIYFMSNDDESQTWKPFYIRIRDDRDWLSKQLN